MRIGLAAGMALGVSVLAASAAAQPAPLAPVQGEGFSTVYVRNGSPNTEGLLYQPAKRGPKARIALVYAHPNANTFNEPIGREMARRGYPVLMINYRGGDVVDDAYLPSLSLGVAYMRALPGVQKVVLVGHSGGGHLVTLYQNVAEHGPSACQGPEKLYPCKGEGLEQLQRPDGLVLLDPTLGAFHQMSSVDPAVQDEGRNPELDMFDPRNGYDLAEKRATYSAAFAKRFHAAQAARNARIVEAAAARLKALEGGGGQFSDDEPLVIPGMGVQAVGARLYQPDTRFAARTKAPHLLLRATGGPVTMIIPSVRPPSGQQALGNLRTLKQMSQATTVRDFLRASAIRTGPDFAITADDIVGVDWSSAMTATPANARGVSVPALVMTMSCHYLVVPGEIIFNSLASQDKSYASVEGATHLFQPCRPEYGDTVGRTFDHLDGWLGKSDRF